MDNQKDTLQYQKDSSVSTEVSSLNTKVFSDFVIKKTEKLVTALYMVTDCMERDDSMKTRLRTLGVELLSNSHSFIVLIPIEKQNAIEKSHAHIAEVLSLVDIASMMGFVSEMNANILKKEFNILRGEIARFEQENNISKSLVKKSYPHTGALLNEQSFSLESPTYKTPPLLPSQFWQDDSSKELIKDTVVLYKNKKDKTAQDEIADYRADLQKMTLMKEDRKIKIVNLIKQKGEISIKDISFEFTECSEKTIQRELNNLVEKGLLKKTGSKRWSRYAVI